MRPFVAGLKRGFQGDEPSSTSPFPRFILLRFDCRQETCNFFPILFFQGGLGCEREFGSGGCRKNYWMDIYCNTIDGMFQETTSVTHSWLGPDRIGRKSGFGVDGSSLTIGRLM